jgi:hypothetical protein
MVRLLVPPGKQPPYTTYWLARTGLVFTCLGLPAVACDTIAAVALASRVVEYECIPNATPFQWWARSNTMTADDGMLLGGVAGALLANRSVALRTLFNRSFARLGS